ncbi:hypothetical protein HOLleu_42355 [Holothuria leucospilota]|uniref:Uncharacterized protein n=1 Tax=Holothuria leucospilota TaxID=206669 RepID=A0A9Q0YCR9_HOLLE|nr:hypothetical protein HOLleu_42355 [Holothuria leucospilota]
MYGPHLDGDGLHARRQHESLLHKLARTRSDIVFLSQCKRLNAVPYGLRIRNPFKSENKRLNLIAEKICCKASQQLRNHAIKNAYSKQSALSYKLRTSEEEIHRHVRDTCTRDNALTALDLSYKRELHNSFKRKLRELDKLISKDTLLNELQFSGHPSLTEKFPKNLTRTSQSKRTSNVMNLSDHTLSKHEEDVLQHSLTFCPSRKLDPVGVCHVLPEFIRRVSLKEYFKDEEQQTARTPTYRPPQKSNWTPSGGRNSFIDKFAMTA